MESVAESRTADIRPAAGSHRHLLIGLITVLLCLGVQMVLSASFSSRPGDREAIFLGRHLMWLTVSIAAAWLASRIPAEQLRAWCPAAFWLLLLLLVAVLTPGIGSRINGAQRWLRFAGFSL